MNKMHTLAKVLITIIGMYWLITGGIYALQSWYIINSMRQMDKADVTVVMMIVSLLVQIIILILIITILYKRGKIAEKIVGETENSPPGSQLDWIPFAYRLMSVIAGLSCFRHIMYYITQIASRLVFRMQTDTQYIIQNSMLPSCISLLMLLAAGIYLICGAPHFVRWQVKKTLEMCADSEKKN
ncbi:MAG: hypothetical protein JW806_09540 [Sedimentisphaerales bacterium]|nr:hypothetical protein [Sedimentisphaerales bacterium]